MTKANDDLDFLVEDYARICREATIAAGFSDEMAPTTGELRAVLPAVLARHHHAIGERLRRKRK